MFALQSALHILPESFLERLVRILPAADYARTLASFQRVGPVTFRVNTLRGEKRSVIATLMREGFRVELLPWPDYAYSIPAGQKRALTESASFRQGAIYIQNLASMLAVEILAPKPGEEILDLCAAPGGKTSQMAMLMANRGRIAAVEPVKERYWRLKANLDRLGVTISRCYRMDGRAVGVKTPGRFDRILVDAPCSSETRFSCLAPESFEFWSLSKIKALSYKQKQLLLSALKALIPGGRLLYCTCSFAPEENEQVVDFTLRTLGSRLSLLPIDLPLTNRQSGLTKWQGESFHPSLTRAVRILPDERMNGFFLCLMEKQA